MLFGEGTNFTSKRRKFGIATVRSVQIKVETYSVSGETCVDLDSHAYTIILGKECTEIYNCNHSVNV